MPAAVLAVGCTLAIASCASPRAATPPPDVVSRLSPAQLAGQMSIASFIGTVPPAGLRERIRQGRLAGVIIYTANVSTRAALASTVRSLQAIPRPAGLDAPLLILLDQEGGEVKRISGPPRDSAAVMGRRDSTPEVLAEGAATALNLRAVGANVDLAPVADVGRPGSLEERQYRAFSRDAGTVGRLASAFMQGLQSRGIAATVKHFPGLGVLPRDPDAALQRVTLSRAELRRVDEAPFATAIAAGPAIVMVGNAIYTALARGPALLSEAIVSGELRGRLGYRGVILGDTLTTPALAGLGSPQQLVTMAAGAGIDLMIFDGSDATNVSFIDALARAAADGSLARARLEASVRRVLALRGWVRRR